VRKFLSKKLVVFLCGLFVRVISPAGEPGASPRATAAQSGGGESYGPGANFLVIPASAFVPVNNLIQYTVDANGYVMPSGGGINTFKAGVELPAGALVVNVCGFTFDTSAAFPAHVTWDAVETGDATSAPKFVELAGGFNGAPADTPGYGQTCVGLAAPTEIRKFRDLDGDGNSHFTWYQVTIYATTGFGGAVVTWLRTVSPAPAAATFGDVPTSYLYFRAIEALAASGITGGCGGGNFCPGQSVTRGEMAAFLARALGLHWPS
jgi:hypothetical protein